MILKQHGLELHESAYTWIFFTSKCYTSMHSSVGSIQECEMVNSGANFKINYGFSVVVVWGYVCSAPNPELFKDQLYL